MGVWVRSPRHPIPPSGRLTPRARLARAVGGAEKWCHFPMLIVRQLSRTQDLLTFWWPPSCSPHKGVALRRCVVATTRRSSMPARHHFLRPSLETPRRYGVPSSRRCVGASVQRHACTIVRRCASAPRHRQTSFSHPQIFSLILQRLLFVSVRYISVFSWAIHPLRLYIKPYLKLGLLKVWLSAVFSVRLRLSGGN